MQVVALARGGDPVSLLGGETNESPSRPFACDTRTIPMALRGVFVLMTANTTARVGLGVEVQDHGPAGVVAQRDLLPVLVGERELGGLLTSFDHARQVTEAAAVRQRRAPGAGRSRDPRPRRYVTRFQPLQPSPSVHTLILRMWPPPYATPSGSAQPWLGAQADIRSTSSGPNEVSM